MPTMEDVRRKMNANRAFPSDTAFFYGLTEEENNMFPNPYPRIEECDITVQPDGIVSFSRKTVRTAECVQVPAELLAGPTLRQLNLRREDVKIVVDRLSTEAE